MAGVYRNGSITVELGGELESYVDRVVREVLPDTHRALKAEVFELRQYAQRNWPVLTYPDPAAALKLRIAEQQGKLRGKLSFESRDSKGKWFHGVAMTPHGLEAFVINRAPYAAFAQIPKDKKKGKGKKYYHKELLFKRFGARRQNALWAKIKKELG